MSRQVAMEFGSSSILNNASGSLRFNLLWENASPDAAFSAQSIAVDLSGYSFFVVEVHFANNASVGYVPLQWFPADEKLHILQIASGNNADGERSVQYSATNKTLTFGAGRYNNNSNNNYVLPTAVYGVT